MTGNVTTESNQHSAVPIRCAVIGQPIAHSKSPAIHQAFAGQFGLALVFDRIDCAPAELPATVQAFFAAGGRGLSVTLPHKPAALLLVAEISERARQAGAANTLGIAASGQLWADNTDGIGLLRDLQRLAIAVRGQRVLVLGAGGAAAGVVPALLAEQPAVLALANRTAARAQELAARYPAGAVTAASVGDEPYDLVISTVSSGAAELLASLPVRRGGSGYDLNYGDRAEPGLHAMRERGLSNCHDGRGMLIEQAAVAFARWHGRSPDTSALHRDGF